MNQFFTIVDDKVVIRKLALTYLEGTVNHAGQLNIVGPIMLQSNLNVEGTLSVDTIKVKNLITESGSANETGRWAVSTENELNGKGFSWTWGNGGVQLIYRKDNRLWTNANFDLDASKSYKIDNTEVLSLNHLGSQVSKSSLKEVGVLTSLEVSGDARFSKFANFKSSFKRLGLNTDQPNAGLSVVENDIETVVGSLTRGSATIGSYTNHDLEIVTDQTPRITVKNNGDVYFGNELSKNTTVTIHGTLHVDNLISDTRIERTSPIEFKSTRDTSIYNQGLVWTSAEFIKKLVMLPGPDRLWSSDSIDLDENKEYLISGQTVLSKSSLGSSIKNSSLTSVGELDSLVVNGSSVFHNTVTVDTLSTSTLTINSSKVVSATNISLNVNSDETYYADQNEITIGNKLNSRRPVKVFGPVSIGINNPDPNMGLSVSGNISFADKKFITGTHAPQISSFSKGDICWNQDPKESSYIGWVCVVDGSPGTWLPFGAINKQ